MRALSPIDLVFRPLAVSLLVGAVTYSLVGLLGLFAPGWDGRYLVLICMLAALEAAWVYHLIQNSLLRVAGAYRVRAIEAVMLFLLLQIGANVSLGRAMLADIPRFDGLTWISVILVVFSWLAGTQTARDFDRLGEPPERSHVYTSPFERLASRFFEGAVILLLSAGITRVGFAQLLDTSRQSIAEPLMNVLLYFLIGVVLLGQAQYAMLRSRWQEQGLAIGAGLPGRWLRYSLAFLGVVVLLAALLPTSYTVGLLDLLRAILAVMFYVLTVLAMVLIFPFAWLLSLVRGTPSEGSPVSFGAAPVPQFSEEAAGGDWIGLSKSLLFWGIVLLVVGYMVRAYLLQHPEIARFLRRFAPFHLLARLWSMVRGKVRHYASVVAARRPRRLAPHLLARGIRRPVRLGGLPPREQIRYYYRSVLHRAARQGFPRQRPQTPVEYQALLASRLPEAAQDVEQLTQAFMEARYSRHEVEPLQANRSRSNWQRVKAALQSLKRRVEREGRSNPS